MAPQERESTHVTTNSSTFKPKLWVPGDWNAFFGLGTNVLLNVLVLSGLALFVVQIPAENVYGRILPALGIALPLGNLFYAYLAFQLARKEGRSDVAAMPYGPSVPHYFFVTFVIMLPVFLKTGDAIEAWQAGLLWALFIGLIVILGAFIGPDDPAVHAARRDARHPGRHLDRVHRHAPGVPDDGRRRGSPSPRS